MKRQTLVGCILLLIYVGGAVLSYGALMADFYADTLYLCQKAPAFSVEHCRQIARDFHEEDQALALFGSLLWPVLYPTHLSISQWDGRPILQGFRWRAGP